MLLKMMHFLYLGDQEDTFVYRIVSPCEIAHVKQLQEQGDASCVK